MEPKEYQQLIVHDRDEDRPPLYSNLAENVLTPALAPQEPRIVKRFCMEQPVVGPESTTIVCPSCLQTIETRLHYLNSSTTHCMVLMICCLFWPFSWLPYAMNSCKDVAHYCPNCSAYIGMHKF